jgi:Na+-transporting NADH:ubiquinone oxidoreductase subunit B
LILRWARFLVNVLHGALYFVPVFLVTNIVGGTWEMIFGVVRRHDINEGFLVTGMLFPLTLPPTIPLWQVALGISFGVVFGKEVFGGTGKNFLNPALTARAFLYFAYPGQIIGDKVWVAVDGYTGPTLLTSMGSVRNVAPDSFKTVASSLNMSWYDAFMGWIPGSMGETSTLACLLGAAFLILTGVGSWRIMAGVLIGAFGLAGLLNGVASETNAVFQVPAHWHLVTGGLAFGIGIHGDGSGVRCDDRNRQMVLRNPDRRDDDHHSRDQSCFS